MTLLNLFKVFLWKNGLFVKYNKLSILFMLSIVAMTWIYLVATNSTTTAGVGVAENIPADYLNTYFSTNMEDVLAYAPKTDFTYQLMNKVRIELSMPAELLKGYDDELEMRSQVEGNCTFVCYSVYFESLPTSKGEGGNLNIRISSNLMRLPPGSRFVNDERISEFKETDEYIRTGFFALQHLITKNFIKNRTASEFSDYDLEVLPMATIEHDVADSSGLLSFGFIFSALINILLLSSFLVPLVEEKQDGIKEFLVIATPYSFLNGLTFCMIRFVLYLCLVLATLGVAYAYRTFGTVSFICVLVLFVLYVLSAMAYTYLISVCFNSVFYAKVGGIVMLMGPYIFYAFKSPSLDFTTKLFCSKALLEGLEVCQTFSNKYRPLTFAELNYQILEGSSAMSTIFITLLAQCAVYALLYFYLSSVFPGPGGIRKPFLFFLQNPLSRPKSAHELNNVSSTRNAIIIEGLGKQFKTPARTISIADNLDLDIRDKQITVLLGHNGAGKTTTLNMIMGCEPLDYGKIIVCSERDVSAYRHLIGFCPQHSVFMNYMTCSQHLEFFAQLRGLSADKAADLAQELLEELKLSSKTDMYGKHLSGGMKRRLSLGIAIAGDTKVIILDEPSSGLDIESRRELWDILLKVRKQKAILVTTHHMEEAEVLGDTVCILANGRIQRCGTPLDLKRKDGCGYILKINADMAGEFNERKTLDLIRDFVPEATVMNVVPPTVLISLPYKNLPKYSDMLRKLEAEPSNLGIKSISITDTSLEDVFLKCADGVSGDQVDSAKTSRINIPYEPLNSPCSVTRTQHFSAILYKKLMFMRNEWLYVSLMVSLPILSVIVGIVLMTTLSNGDLGQDLKLKPNIYQGGTIYVHNSYGDWATHKLEELLRKDIEEYGLKAGKFDNVEWSLTNALIELQRQDYPGFLENAIGVIEIGKSANGTLKLILHFSVNAYHSSVILLNLAENALVSAASNGSDAVEVFYKPMRRAAAAVSPGRLEYFAALVPIGLFFYIFYYVSLPFREHLSGFKDLQVMPRCRYWAFTFACDVLLHLVVCIILYGVLNLLLPDNIYHPQNRVSIAASAFFYGLSYLPVLYCLANSMRSISTISTYLLFALVVSAIAPLITSSTIKAMIEYEDYISLLSVLPDFNLNHQLRVINERFLLTRNLPTGSSRHRSLLTSDTIPSTSRFYGYASMVLSFGFLCLLYFVENKYRPDIWQSVRSKFTKVTSQESDESEESELVQTERAIVANILKENSATEYPLVVSDLQKSYGRLRAVRGIDFAVRRRECFGLLGVNGAGKTSTFQMITTNSKITKGTVQIDGVDILRNENAYRAKFGYCPQNDCLDKFMTAQQTLKFMAKLRGISKDKQDEEVSHWMEKFDLVEYANTRVRYYSGGTKRKLNAALAMIGSPPLVLLDEPTTGVDPVSKRFLWKSIQEFQNRDNTVVLTSHSLDECEQLCNRLAIMANGRIKCLGEVPELKQTFGAGFTLTVKLKTDEPSESEIVDLTNRLKGEFHNDVELQEHHAGLVTYFVKHLRPILWSSVFDRTERFMRDCASLIEVYSVNETTLEDIFLRCDTYDGRSIRNTNHIQEF